MISKTAVPSLDYINSVGLVTLTPYLLFTRNSHCDQWQVCHVMLSLTICFCQSSVCVYVCVMCVCVCVYIYIYIYMYEGPVLIPTAWNTIALFPILVQGTGVHSHNPPPLPLKKKKKKKKNPSRALPVCLFQVSALKPPCGKWPTLCLSPWSSVDFVTA